MNYRALAISVLASAAIFGYILMESKKLDDAAQAHRPAAEDLVAPAR